MGRVVALSYRWEGRDRNLVGTVRDVGPMVVVLETTRPPVRQHCISLADVVAVSDRERDPHDGNRRPDPARA
jgi:hypothetical protein